MYDFVEFRCANNWQDINDGDSYINEFSSSSYLFSRISVISSVRSIFRSNIAIAAMKGENIARKEVEVLSSDVMRFVQKYVQKIVFSFRWSVIYLRFLYSVFITREPNLSVLNGIFHGV